MNMIHSLEKQSLVLDRILSTFEDVIFNNFDDLDYVEEINENYYNNTMLGNWDIACYNIIKMNISRNNK